MERNVRIVSRVVSQTGYALTVAGRNAHTYRFQPLTEYDSHPAFAHQDSVYTHSAPNFVCFFRKSFARLVDERKKGEDIQLVCCNYASQMPLFYTPKLTDMLALRRTLPTGYSRSRAVTFMSNILTPDHPLVRAYLSGAVLLAVLVGFFLIDPSELSAQWRRKTPRDTVKVNANSKSWKPTKMTLAAGFQIQAKYKGTFGLYSGQAGKGIDAKYTYDPVPGWSTPLPLVNPPTFNGRTDNFYVALNRESPDLKPNGEAVKFIETTYQSTHNYTSLHTSLGIPLNFRIFADKDSYYGNGTGTLTIELAQFTAGISMRSQVLPFGNVNIGSSSTLPDSIASYGVDPLLVDSVRIRGIGGNPASDFTVISERTAPFALADENANQFNVTYTPSSRGQLNAFLYIYCRNTDGANRIKVVQLSGYGVAPSISLGQDTVNFGPVRVGRTEQRPVFIYNGGNGVLEITSAAFTGDNGFFSAVVPSTTNPIRVSPNSTGQLLISFTPTAQRKYRGVVTIKGKNVPQDSVILLAEGAEPNLIVSDTILDFGPVRRNDRAFRSFTLRNTGTMTANILYCGLGGPNSAAYSMTPNETKFTIDAKESKVFDVKFEPTTGPDGSRVGWVDITLDDGKPSRRVLLMGIEVEPKMLLGRNLLDFGYIKVGTTKWDTVSMYNNSNAVLAFNDITIKPNAGSEGVFGYDTLDVTPLLPNTLDSMRLSFRPSDRKQFGGWVHTNVNGQRDSVYVTGTGVLPIAVFEPPILDFGIVPTAWSKNQFTSLSDTGDYKMEVCDIIVTGPDAAYFTVKTSNPALPTTVDPFSNKVNIPVEFKTNAATGRTYHAWLKVIYCDGSADSVQMIAKEQAQMLEFGERTVDFGKVRVKSGLTKPASLSNGSNTTLSVGTLYISSTPPYFSTTQSSATVDKKSQGEVPVTFAPQTKGDFAGYLVARGGDIKTDSILLKGTGAAPLPKFSDTVINFGTVVPPSDKVENLIVENIGDWFLKARVFIANDEYGEFTLSTAGVPYDSIAEGGAPLTYPITFKPNTPQLIHTADLMFVLDDSSTYIVKLIGKDESQYISVDSTHINFGKVRVGQVRKASAHIVNTWSADRTALDVSVTPPDPTITASPLGQITVNSRSLKPIEVTFAPTNLGNYSAILIAKGGDVNGEDTLLITGIGAEPKLQFAESLIDFGTIVVGDDRTLPATIANEGNWLMHVTDARLAGTNANDFSFDIASDTTIEEAESRTFNVSFLATTPLQAAQRTAQIIFTLDDGTEHPLELRALDKAPVLTDIGFGDYYARPGDKIFAVMKLKTAIPQEIFARNFEGVVEYDATLLDLLTIEKVGLMEPADWNLDTAATRTPGRIDFTLSSTSTDLRDPGSLLRIVFQAKKDLDRTAQTPLRLTLLNYLDTRELVAAMNDGNIVIDSSCGASQIIAGDGAPNGSSSIQQNHPNPFGVRTGRGQTDILYDVSSDDAIVTIRVMDATGREVARPIDSRSHAKGIYELRLDAAQFGSGTYFYEFNVVGQKPMVRKMIVSD